MFKPVEAEARRLRRYDADAVLDMISRVSTLRWKNRAAFGKALESEKLEPEAALRDYQLAFVVKLVLCSYDRPRLSSRKFDLRRLAVACGTLSKHQTPNEYPIRSSEDVHRVFAQIAYQQFPDFYGEKDTFARTRLLFRECARTVNSRRPFDIDEAFSAATGLTLDQVWDITFALCGQVLSSSGGIQRGPIQAGDLASNVSDSELSQFIEMISLGPKEYRDRLQMPECQLDPFEGSV